MPAAAPAPAAVPIATSLPAAPVVVEPTATVVTIDGAVFRGELVEKWPNRHVTLRLSTGEYRRVLWQHIRQLSTGASAPLGATTRVFFRSESAEATLQRVHPGGTWFDVCRTPCAGAVATRGVYRVAGDGIRPSDPFTLSGHGSQVALSTTRVGTQGTSVLGAVLAIGGGAAAYAGMLVLMTSAPAAYAEDWEDDGDEERWEDAQSAGLLLMLGGTAVGVVGIVTMARNRTKTKLVNLEPRRGALSVPERGRASFSIPISSGLALTERGLVF